MESNINTLNPLVSVIIPNYNHAKYLDQRIQSVLDQTYQNFEVIILDDNSTDNSKEVIEKYRNNTHVSHIIYNEKNSGNTFIQWYMGFGVAKGDYFWLAESDDYSSPDFLGTLIGSCEKDTSICYCISQLVNEVGKNLEPVINDLGITQKRTGRDFIMQEMRTSNAIINASSAIFRADRLKKIGQEYQNFVAAGDRLFWILLAEQGNVTWVGKPMNFFRQHNNKVSPRKLIDGTTFREDHQIYQYLYRNGYVSFTNDIEIRESYINKILSTSFLSKDIEKEVKNLWIGHYFSTSILTALNRLINYTKLILKYVKKN